MAITSWLKSYHYTGVPSKGAIRSFFDDLIFLSGDIVVAKQPRGTKNCCHILKRVKALEGDTIEYLDPRSSRVVAKNVGLNSVLLKCQAAFFWDAFLFVLLVFLALLVPVRNPGSKSC